MMMTVNINLQLARDFRGEVAFDFLFCLLALEFVLNKMQWLINTVWDYLVNQLYNLGQRGLKLIIKGRLIISEMISMDDNNACEIDPPDSRF